MSEMYDELAKMQEETLNSLSDIDSDIDEERFGTCTYCGEEERKETLKEYKGLCEICFEEALDNWRGAKE